MEYPFLKVYHCRKFQEDTSIRSEIGNHSWYNIISFYRAYGLGAIIGDKLSFKPHVEFLVSKCNTRLFWMRTQKTLGMDSVGLKTFYVSNIRSLLIYGDPTRYTIFSDQCKEKLESTQRSAARFIFPDLAYEDRLELFVLQTLNNFIFCICKKHFDMFQSWSLALHTNYIQRLFLDQRYQILRSAPIAFFQSFTNNCH